MVPDPSVPRPSEPNPGFRWPVAVAVPLSSALEWITALLETLEIPYQVVGGLAARAYGASRPLADMDLYVPSVEDLDCIAAAAHEHTTRAPHHHRDAHWNLTYLMLERSGWSIEIGAGESAKVWDGRSGTWRPAEIRFDRSEEMMIEGVRLQVMPLAQLIDYKEGLARRVDVLDVAMLRTTDS